MSRTTIHITETLTSGTGRDNVFAFGGGQLLITHAGTASTTDRIVSTPRMSEYADMTIGQTMTHSVSMRVKSDALRVLAAEMLRCADLMDQRMVPEVEYRPATLLRIDEATGDTYYTGDLAAGKWLAKQDRYPLLDTNDDGTLTIALCDDEDRNDWAEWGSGPDEDTAWRFALGAAFGPLDAEYDEDALLKALAQYRPEQGYDPEAHLDEQVD